MINTVIKRVVVCLFIVTFSPQNHEVVLLLEVQLRGEDEWLRVRISCPLIQTNGNRTELIPLCEW